MCAEEKQRRSYKKRAAVLEIETTDGRQIVERTDYPKGEPENPMSTEELCDKFTGMMLSAGKEKAEIEEIKKTVFQLERADVRKLRIQM